jgi:hypothetical protein
MKKSCASPTLQGIVIKGSIVLWAVLIFDDCLLKLPAIRRLFGLEVKEEYRSFSTRNQSFQEHNEHIGGEFLLGQHEPEVTPA